MKVLVIFADTSPQAARYATGLRLAQARVRAEATEVQVFLIGCAVECATARRVAPAADVDVARLLVSVISSGSDVRVCSTSLADRAIDTADLLIGVVSATTGDLASLALSADRVLVF